MINIFDIKKALDSNKEVNLYTVNELKENRYELYFVLDKVETARLVNVITYHITVYKKYGEELGSYSYELNSASSLDELNKSIEVALSRSEFSKNKLFDLPEPSKEYLKLQSNIENEPLEDIAFKVSKSIFKADTLKDGWINSTEIFVNKNYNHFISSKGVDVNYVSCGLFIELIPTFKGKKEEVELYFSSRTDNVDYDLITNDIKDILFQAKERGEAVAIPEELKNANVIFRNSSVSQILSYLPRELNYSGQLRQTSKHKVGDNMDCHLTITMEPVLSGSALSCVIDNYGTPLKSIKIIEDGKAVNLYGEYVEGKLLGVDNPTGSIPNFKVSSKEEYSYSELTKEPYLEIYSFSALQVDRFSGFFGGEVRLGMYFDGKKVTPVSGFSVAGNIFTDLNKMKFSKEHISINGYSGPKYFLCPMTVTK